MKDLRCPTAIGERLLESAQAARGAYGADIPLHEVWDVHAQHLTYPETASEGPLERYGDPVAKHEALIEAGLAARLP